MNKKILSFVFMALTMSTTAQTPVYLNPKASVEERVQDALSRMTTHEKIQILHAQSKFTSAGVPRLGIRQLNMDDGPHGVRAELDWNTWGSANWTNDSVVAFPSLTCLAATWNTNLSALYGQSVSEEFAFRGKDVMLGPGCTIARTPLCGRNFEYTGEDPYLAGETVTPYIQAVQKNGVAACLKHFFLNNQEIDRNTVNVNISERAVNEIYLPAFKKAVQRGGLWTIMCSYNKWLNEYCGENDSLLNGILKRQWDFDGAVISDWGAVHDTYKSATGGMDIEMGSYTDGFTKDAEFGYNDYFLADKFEQMINEGRIPVSVLNEKAARVLRTIFRTSMNPEKVIGSQCSEAHYEACEKIGEEGIVLLKNDKNILPIAPNKYRKILVVGENAERSLTQGGGSSELKTLYDISPLDGIRKVYGADVEYVPGYYSGRAHYSIQDALSADSLDQLRDEAVRKAREADLVIYIGGLNKNAKQDCESNDRESYNLSFGQDALISLLAKANKNVVVVTFGGNAYATPWIGEVKALVHCWYLGSMAGTSLANVLCGKVNPSGKLPVTFARDYNDYPYVKYGQKAYPGVDLQVDYAEGIYVGYRGFLKNNTKPQFPFGYGLSYTTFKYGKPAISAPTMGRDGELTVSVSVTNTGKTAGKEVVELYVGENNPAVDRPARELKGFAKISLNPGETKVVSLPVRYAEIGYFSESEHRFVTASGSYTAYMASSSADTDHAVEFTVK